MTLYCCGCQKDITARLTNGVEAYPNRPDLYELPFWICDACRNFVGCHHKTKKPTRPLGCIPTLAIKNARKHIHALLDPIWQSSNLSRRDVYRAVSQYLGRPYHTGDLRSVEECRGVYRFVRDLAKDAITPDTQP